MIPGRILTPLVTVLVCLASAPAVHGQSYRSRVSGIVTDQSGAVVANATVTLSNVNTGTRSVRNTSETGLFLFDLDRSRLVFRND